MTTLTRRQTLLGAGGVALTATAPRIEPAAPPAAPPPPSALPLPPIAPVPVAEIVPPTAPNDIIDILKQHGLDPARVFESVVDDSLHTDIAHASTVLNGIGNAVERYTPIDSNPAMHAKHLVYGIWDIMHHPDTRVETMLWHDFTSREQLISLCMREGWSIPSFTEAGELDITAFTENDPCAAGNIKALLDASKELNIPESATIGEVIALAKQRAIETMRPVLFKALRDHPGIVRETLDKELAQVINEPETIDTLHDLFDVPTSPISAADVITGAKQVRAALLAKIDPFNMYEVHGLGDTSERTFLLRNQSNALLDGQNAANLLKTPGLEHARIHNGILTLPAQDAAGLNALRTLSQNPPPVVSQPESVGTLAPERGIANGTLSFGH